MSFPRVSLPFILFAALPLAAGDGRIPIAAAPFAISSPGTYYLTRDLSGTATLITIAAAGVTLDLAGHTLTSTSVTAGVAVIASTDASTELEIANGRVSGAPIGIQLGVNGGGGNIRLHDLQLTGQTALGVSIPTAVSATRNVALDRLQIALTSGGGVSCANCEGLRVADASVYATGAPATNGLYAGGAGGLITDSSVRGFNYGIFLNSAAGYIVARNTVTGAALRGIYLSTCSRNQVRDNQVANVAAGGAGLEMRGDQNTAEGNSLMNDGAYGLVLGSGTLNVYGNNRSQGNTTANYNPGSGNIDAGGNF